MNNKHLTTILIVLILAGCATSRYQLSRDAEGRIIRLDTQTGEVMLVEGDKLTPVKAPEMGLGTAKHVFKEEEISTVELPDGGKSWPTLTVPDLGNANAELTSYWHNGKMRYVLELYPMSKRLKLIYARYYTNPTFTLTMNDTAGKQVMWNALPGNQMKRTYNKSLKVKELSSEGVVVMTKGEYDSLASWQLQWNP